MGKDSGITWTTHTFNHVRGCDEVSPGCAHCYAKTLSKRNPLTLGKWGSENEGGVRVVAADSMWAEPLKWNREAEQFKSWSNWVRPRVFSASLADWAEDWQGPMVNHKGETLYRAAMGWTAGKLRETGERKQALSMSDVRQRLFKLIDLTKNLDWLMLTKRPGNIRAKWPERCGLHYGWVGPKDTFDGKRHFPHRENVWLGTTVENQKYANQRIPELLKCRDLAPVLFLSVEPMLGPVDLCSVQVPAPGHKLGPDQPSDNLIDALSGEVFSGESGIVFAEDQPKIDWVICGCESGPHRRPMDLAWARDLRDQCKAADVPFFLKQIEVDGKVTDDAAKFPSDLQIQEFPTCTM